MSLEYRIEVTCRNPECGQPVPVKMTDGMPAAFDTIEAAAQCYMELLKESLSNAEARILRFWSCPSCGRAYLYRPLSDVYIQFPRGRGSGDKTRA